MFEQIGSTLLAIRNGSTDAAAMKSLDEIGLALSEYKAGIVHLGEHWHTLIAVGKECAVLRAKMSEEVSDIAAASASASVPAKASSFDFSAKPLFPSKIAAKRRSASTPAQKVIPLDDTELSAF